MFPFPVLGVTVYVCAQHRFDKVDARNANKWLQTKIAHGKSVVLS